MSPRNKLALQVMRALYMRITGGEPPANPPRKHHPFKDKVRQGELVALGGRPGVLCKSWSPKRWWFIPFTRFTVPVGTAEYRVKGDYGKGRRVVAVWCRQQVSLPWFRSHGELAGGVLDAEDVAAFCDMPNLFRGDGIPVKSVKSFFAEAMFDTLLFTQIAMDGGKGLMWLPDFRGLVKWLDSIADYRPPKAEVVPSLWSLNLGGGMNKKGYIHVYIEFLRDCYKWDIADLVIRTIAHEHRHLQQFASNGALPYPAHYEVLGSDEEDDAYDNDLGELDAEAFALRAMRDCPEEIKNQVKEEIMAMENSIRDLLVKAGGYNEPARCEALVEFLNGREVPCPCEEAGESGCPLAKEVRHG